MGRETRYYGHLIRVAVVFGLGFLAFVIIRHSLVPTDFGVYGFYRAGALDAARALPISFAGRDVCEVCHVAVVESQKESRHTRVSCESCHGPLAKHASGEFNPKPKTLHPRELCLSCHVKMAGKYDGFPQVDPADHGGDFACTACHQPHQPKIAMETGKKK